MGITIKMFYNIRTQYYSYDLLNTHILTYFLICINLFFNLLMIIPTLQKEYNN